MTRINDSRVANCHKSAWLIQRMTENTVDLKRLPHRGSWSLPNLSSSLLFCVRKIIQRREIEGESKSEGHIPLRKHQAWWRFEENIVLWTDREREREKERVRNELSEREPEIWGVCLTCCEDYLWSNQSATTKRNLIHLKCHHERKLRDRTKCQRCRTRNVSRARQPWWDQKHMSHQRYVDLEPSFSWCPQRRRMQT